MSGRHATVDPLGPVIVLSDEDPYEVVLNAAALASMPQLQHLQLRDVWWTNFSYQPHADFAGLLLEVGKLQHLSLVFTSSMIDAVPFVQWPAAAAYSALTASSNLQLFEVSAWCMPSGAWEHVFPPTKRLPKLRALIVEPVVGQDRGLPDLACVVRCCPGLQQLSVQQDIRSHDSLSLQSLTASINLSDLKTGVVDNAGAAVLPQLTSLRCLKVAGISEAGGLRLSMLQQLTALSGSIPYAAWRGRASGRIKVVTALLLSGMRSAGPQLVVTCHFGGLQ